MENMGGLFIVYRQSKINPDHYGHGKPGPYEFALAAVNYANKKYPFIDHWLEPAVENEPNLIARE